LRDTSRYQQIIAFVFRKLWSSFSLGCEGEQVVMG